MIHNLAKNPDKQEKLYQELKEEVTPGKPISAELLEDKLSYLKAVIKESDRYAQCSGTGIVFLGLSAGRVLRPNWRIQGGRQGREHPPPPRPFGPISFIFMQFSAKILPNNSLLIQIQRLMPPVWKIRDPRLD